jgi:predicted PurR-regulated permease PerM
MDMREEKSQVTVTIAHRTIFLVVAVVLVAWLATRLTHVLIVVFLAILLATAIDRPTAWLQRKGVPRSLGALLCFAGVVAALIGVVLLLVPAIQAELEILRTNLPTISARVQNLLNRFSRESGTAPSFSLAQITDRLAANVNTIAGRLTSVTLAVGRGLVLVFAMFIIAFFLAIDETQIPRFVERIVPPPNAGRVNAVIAGIQLRIGSWVQGQLVIAVSFGVAMGLGLWLIGVPYAATLGSLAAVLELIPYLGGAVTVVLASLMALPLGWGHVIAVIVLYVVLILLESHVLAPVLYGHAVGLPSIAVLIALLIGVELIGVLGALLAVPAAVIVWAIVEEIWPDPRPRARRRPRLPRVASRRVAHAADAAVPVSPAETGGDHRPSDAPARADGRAGREG